MNKPNMAQYPKEAVERIKNAAITGGCGAFLQIDVAFAILR
jgi:hypothetical protein